MVPGQVRGVLVCAYAGLNDAHPRQLVSGGNAGLRPSRLLQRRLNGAQVPTGRTYNCPMDDASTYYVAFRYRTGGPQQLSVSRTGCRFATNGKRYVFATDKVEHQLATISTQ